MHLTFTDVVTSSDVLSLRSEEDSPLSLDMLMVCRGRYTKQKKVSWLELVVRKIATYVYTIIITYILAKNET